MNILNTALSPDSFSLRRAWLFGMTFRRQIMMQFLVAVLIVAGLGILNLLSASLSDTAFKATYYLLTIATGFIIYCSPIVFATKDDTSAYLVPASISEKVTFYVIYSVVAFPLTIWLLDGLYMFIGSLIIDSISFRQYIVEKLVGRMPDGMSAKSLMEMVPYMWVYIVNVIMVADIVLLTLAVVLFSRTHRVLKVILTPLAACFVVGIVSGIVGFVMAFSRGFAAASGADSPGSMHSFSESEITGRIFNDMFMLFPLLSIFELLVAVGLVAFIYRRMKRVRIA